jgi:thioesterase domain-containing protein
VDGAGEEPDEPRNYVEARLIQIWEAVLGRSGIGPARSFFDLGGSSFLALHLFARVNRAFECDLPVSTLFAGATVRNMADAVLEQKRSAPAARASVVPLQPGGSLPPLFLVHAADRDVLGYVSLVRHLGPDQPAYGVRDVGEDLARPLALIAGEHVAAIRAVQPRGPYALAGWSFGGVVAFEMAVQLQRRGEAVSFVGLLDTIAPDVIRELRESDDELLVGLAQEFAERWRWAFSLPPEELDGLPMEEKVERVVRALQAQGPVPADFGVDRMGEGFRIARGRIASSRGYVPGRFHGTLTLFRASVPYAYRDALFVARTAEEAHVLGWGAQVDGTVEVHLIPGSHVTLASEPNVRVLAERMRESLAAGRMRAVPPAAGAREWPRAAPGS